MIGAFGKALILQRDILELVLRTIHEGQSALSTARKEW
jgi:hypothetical protein